MARNAVALVDDDGLDEAAEIIIGQVQDEKEGAKKPSKEEQYRDAISAMLRKLGSMTVQDDALVFEGEKFVLPAQYQGKVAEAVKFLVDYEKQNQQPFNIHKVFNYRPFDGAHAFTEVMRRITGTSGFGVTKWTMFGPVHPSFVSVPVAHNKAVQVPWGAVAFPSYQAEFNIGSTHDDEKGVLSYISCTVPRKWRQHIEAIFQLIEKELEVNSIYRGKAIDGAEQPGFLNLDRVDPDRVVYSQDVLEQLTANVWTPIRYAQKMRQLNIPLKRAVLFAGPYGTGKSLGAMLTSKEAVEHGWTAIMCRPGKDDPAVVLKTAQLYAPAVVVIEDVDVHTEGGSNADISAMLEMLDGIGSKGVEIVALFTTNHLERIQKGALRPGRVDAVIEIHGLDEPAFRKLVTLTVGDEYLDPKVKWPEVATAFDGFLPAFVAEAARRSQQYTMSRNEGEPGIIKTEDLVHAANALRPQLELMEGAKEGATRRSINDQFREEIENVLRRTSNENIGSLEVEELTLLNGGKK